MPCRHCAIARRNGFSLVELLAAIAIGALLLRAISDLGVTAQQTARGIRVESELNHALSFALQRIADHVSRSPGALLPAPDNPATNWPEDVREQSVPAAAPVGDSTFASAVLALRVPHAQDLDRDGVADADNDGDGLFDEDAGADSSNDGAPGLAGIDDDGDGEIDENAIALVADDDEDGSVDEDGAVAAAVDEDADGAVDEDPAADANNDLAQGLSGVDDDDDGAVDEGGVGLAADDDEDGSADEDWIDAVVYYLDGSNLVERLPAPWDVDGGGVSGSDYVESIIATGVTRFRVERLAQGGGWQRMRIALDLADTATGHAVSAQINVRVGGAL